MRSGTHKTYVLSTSCVGAIFKLLLLAGLAVTIYVLFNKYL